MTLLERIRRLTWLFFRNRVFLRKSKATRTSINQPSRNVDSIFGRNWMGRWLRVDARLLRSIEPLSQVPWDCWTFPAVYNVLPPAVNGFGKIRRQIRTSFLVKAGWLSFKNFRITCVRITSGGGVHREPPASPNFAHPLHYAAFSHPWSTISYLPWLLLFCALDTASDVIDAKATHSHDSDKIITS